MTKDSSLRMPIEVDEGTIWLWPWTLRLEASTGHGLGVERCRREAIIHIAIPLRLVEEWLLSTHPALF